jgi:hypothetical protein
MVADAASGWMEANAGQVKYNGGAEVKIPRITMSGLGNYDRALGYAQGSVSLVYQTETMTQDRGREFLLDRMDVDETNFVVTAGAVMGEFQRTHVIPEVDAYRYSKIATLAMAAGNTSTYTPAEATVLQRLNDDLYAIWNKVGENVGLVISMNTNVAKVLDNSDKLQKHLGVSEFSRGEVNTKVKTYNDVPILKVTSERMWTAYDFRTGQGAQSAGGFVKTAAAQAINWIITARNAPIAVSRTDGMYIYPPGVAQGVDGWKIEYRKYHDLWIPENRMAAVRVNVSPL